MYTIIFTLISVAFSYPYAQYGQPSYAYNNVLRAENPAIAYGMMNQAAQTGPAPGFGPMGGMMSMLDAYLPGMFSSPQAVGRTMGMFGLDGSDFNDLREGAMKGDYKKIYGKVFDGNSDFPMMGMMGMGGMGMGGMGMGGGAGGAQTGAHTGAQSNPWMSPFMYGMIDLQRAHAPVNPVNRRLRATRQYGMGMGMGGGMGMGMGMPSMPAFMNAMGNVFQNPQAMSYMSMVLDGSDMADIQEAMGTGDVYKLYRKTMGKGFNPFMFQQQGAAAPATAGSAAAATPAAAASTTPSTPSTPSYSPFSMPLWPFIDV